ncbi:hypothetical protein Syun_031580 [Stephania yunnanensis]|uniref:Retrovirus-related Pol polyprotein from transposon TNT 1-94 n=1 Tax=Stephania yunnanensis TaxID=152371 RepID=A0AAP0DVY0_9MAGN
MYLANCTRPDIALAVNLPARYNSSLTRRHWNDVKRAFDIFGVKLNFQGYADAGFLSDPHKTRSQMRYLFTCGNIAVSWKSVKQTMVVTSSNHSEVLAINEASRECVWLRNMIEIFKNHVDCLQ